MIFSFEMVTLLFPCDVIQIESRRWS